MIPIPILYPFEDLARKPKKPKNTENYQLEEHQGIKIWLAPHLITADLQLWDVGYNIAISSMVKPGWLFSGDPYSEPYFMPDEAFVPGRVYTVKFSKQALEDGVTYEATELGINFVFPGDYTYTLTLIPETIEEPSITISDVVQPTELEAGEIPTLTIYYEVIAPVGLIQLLVRIYDTVTNTLVCETGTAYHGTGPYEWNINPDSWLSSMPAEAWNLRVEIVRWWP